MLDDVPPKFEERLEYGAFRSKPFRPTCASARDHGNCERAAASNASANLSY